MYGLRFQKLILLYQNSAVKHNLNKTFPRIQRICVTYYPEVALS